MLAIVEWVIKFVVFTLKHVPADFHHPLFFFQLLINQEIGKF